MRLGIGFVRRRERSIPAEGQCGNARVYPENDVARTPQNGNGRVCTSGRRALWLYIIDKAGIIFRGGEGSVPDYCCRPRTTIVPPSCLRPRSCYTSLTSLLEEQLARVGNEGRRRTSAATRSLLRGVSRLSRYQSPSSRRTERNRGNVFMNVAHGKSSATVIT